MKEVNEAKKLTRQTPSESQVTKWVEQAKTLEPKISHLDFSHFLRPSPLLPLPLAQGEGSGRGGRTVENEPISEGTNPWPV